MDRMIYVEIKDKLLWSAEEASAMTGIGINKIYEMLNDPRCTFSIQNGRNKLIHAGRFRKFLEGCTII